MNTDTDYGLAEAFLKNVNDRKAQDDNEAYLNNYKNSHIVPKFRYYKDDRDLNYTPKYMPSYTYKTKSLFEIIFEFSLASLIGTHFLNL